jgi:hypothetical protein
VVKIRDLDWVCRRRAVEDAQLLPVGATLFLNISATALLDPLHDVDQLLLFVAGTRAPAGCRNVAPTVCPLRGRRTRPADLRRPIPDDGGVSDDDGQPEVSEPPERPVLKCVVCGQQLYARDPLIHGLLRRGPCGDRRALVSATLPDRGGSMMTTERFASGISRASV